MAAGAFVVYSNAVLEISKGSFDLATDTLVIALLTTSYTPAPNTDKAWSDIIANEMSTGSGYTAGGIVLSGVTNTLTMATVTFTCTAPTWASPFTANFRYAVIVRRAGGSLTGTDLILTYCDCSGGGNVTLGGGALTITPNASGIFTITHSP